MAQGLAKEKDKKLKTNNNTPVNVDQGSLSTTDRNANDILEEILKEIIELKEFIMEKI